ncbi:MAG TPA: hypothetical protein VIH57_26475 [Bacteroidales bacterium]
MKKKLIRILYLLMVTLGVAVALSSCKKTFDFQPEVSVDVSHAYQTLSDADAAVMGVYSGVVNLGAQYVVMNELRADLIDATTNADQTFQDMNNHTYDVAVQESPSKVDGMNVGYADPSPFYEVILNCNDVLKNLTIMRQKLLLTADEYNQRYSDIMAVRCWLYLQLAIQYGEVPYVTEPFEKVSDLNDASRYKRLSLVTIVDTLIWNMEQLPFKDSYPYTATLMSISAGSYNTQPFFINKHILLGDLYLWQDNYYQAAYNYKIVLDSPGPADYQTYRLAYGDVNNHTDYAIAYWQRYQQADINNLINSDTYGWRSIFCRPTQDRQYYQEWIWQLFYDNAYSSSSPFIDLFANYGEGKYLLKPSQEVIDLWNSQTQNNGFPFDARGTLSYTTRNGQPIVMKYLYEYDELTPYKKPGRLFLYRATGLHLHYMEAANRDNKCKLALALLNRGIKREFDPNYDDENGKDTAVNITDNMRTDGGTFQYTFPYNFDGRQDGGSFSYDIGGKSPNGKSAKTGKDTTFRKTITQYPVGIRGAWYQHVAVRGRANVQPVLTSMYRTQDVTLSNSDVLKDSIESRVIEEDALELAFEGERWSDLLRVAIRRDDPSFLADKVYNKLLKAGNPNAITVRNKLIARQWFLPFKLK